MQVLRGITTDGGYDGSIFDGLLNKMPLCILSSAIGRAHLMFWIFTG